jgi:hypothetical protein
VEALLPNAALARRVEMREKTVRSLQKLPADVRALTRPVGRVGSQILRLRGEVRDAFSAIDERWQ